MNNLTAQNSKQLSEKKLVASYVHDAAELESSIYTLKKLEERVYGDIRNCHAGAEKQKKPYYEARDNALSNLEKTKKKIENQNQIIEARQNSVNKAKENLDNPSPLIKIGFFDYIGSILMSLIIAVFGGPIILAALVFVIGMPSVFIFAFLPEDIKSTISEILSLIYPFFPTLLVVLGALIILVMFIVIGINNIIDEKNRPLRIRKAEVEKLQVAYDSALEELKKEQETLRGMEETYRQDEESYNQAIAEVKKANRFDLMIEPQIAAHNDQIAFLRSRKAELQVKLYEFYSIGIIPPDYRHLDCVLMLDRFFRNDLVNTMQEAVRYYDHKVEHGEIISGLDNICNAIYDLNSTMGAVANQIRQLDNNMYSMHRDLLDTLDRQSYQNEEAAKELLEESRAGRYATEKLNETNQRILWYKQQEYYKNNQ